MYVSGFGLAFNNSDLERGFYYPKKLQINNIQPLRLEDCFSPHKEDALNFRGHFCAGVEREPRVAIQFTILGV